MYVNSKKGGIFALETRRQYTIQKLKGKTMNIKTQSEQKEYYRKQIGASLGSISGAIERAVQIKRNMRAELDEVRKKDDILFDETNPGVYYDKTEFRIKNPGFYRAQEQKIKEKATNLLQGPYETAIKALDDLEEAAEARLHTQYKSALYNQMLKNPHN